MIQISYPLLVLIYETLFILAVFYAFREVIISKVYGVRFQRWVIIDTGERGYSILNKALNHMQIKGTERSLNRNNVLKGIAYYVNDNCENLKLDEKAYNQYSAYCNTDEFTTVLHTKLLQMLLYIFEKNLVMVAIILIAVTLALAGYAVYSIHDLSTTVNFIAYKVNLTGSDNVIRVP